MLKALSRNWWLLALRGVLAIIFGILAFVWPDITVGALVILFGIYAIFDGVASLVSGFSDRDSNDRWWVMLLEGVAGLLAGVFAFVWPAITAVVLLYVIAAWAIVTGLLEIFAAIRLREEISGEWALIFSGVLSIIFGAVLFFNPGAGALALVWVIGAYAILFGGLMIYLAFQVRNMDEELYTLEQA